MANNNKNNNLEEILSSACTEDKIWIFYKKYSKQLIIIAIAFLSIVAIFGANMLRNASIEKNMARDFNKLSSIESKMLFVEKYKGEALAGAVSLEIADEHLQENKYSEALKFYKKSLTFSLQESMIFRAKTYMGYCLYNLGEQEEGINQLNTIIEDITINSASRALAEFVKLNIMIERGEKELAIKLAKKATEKDYDAIWNGLFHNINENI